MVAILAHIRGNGRLPTFPMIVLVLVLAPMRNAAAGAAQAFWLGAQSGSWNDPTRWSTNPVYPNNSFRPGNFDVFIDPTGAPCTINVARVRVDNLTITSPDATVLYQFDNDFAVDGVLATNAGTFALGGSAALVDATVRTAGMGTFVFTAGEVRELRNVTLDTDLTMPSSGIRIFDALNVTAGRAGRTWPAVKRCIAAGTVVRAARCVCCATPRPASS